MWPEKRHWAFIYIYLIWGSDKLSSLNKRPYLGTALPTTPISPCNAAEDYEVFSAVAITCAQETRSAQLQLLLGIITYGFKDGQAGVAVIEWCSHRRPRWQTHTLRERTGCVPCAPPQQLLQQRNNDKFSVHWKQAGHSRKMGKDSPERWGMFSKAPHFPI